MRLQPKTLKAGFMEDVSLAPRERVSRICTPSRMALAARVLKMACLINSRDGTFENAFSYKEIIMEDVLGVSYLEPWLWLSPKDAGYVAPA